METAEKIIIVGKLKDLKPWCIFIAVLGIIAYLLDGLVVAFSAISYYKTLGRTIAYAFGRGNGGNDVLVPLIFASPIIAYLVYMNWSKIAITITNKRVYGVSVFRKRVDLPMDSISAVGTGIFSSLVVTTASGAIKFVMLENRDDLHKALSNLLVERQGKSITIEPNSDADELKKYKTLLDSGAITQEEYDAKKKQLLGL